MFYKVELTNDAKTDLDKISKYLEKYGFNKNKIIQRINTDIINLKYMPRIHKTLISCKNPNGEYRRIVSGKYIIIYKIIKNQIIILRIFSQKQNYLNQRNFILKEKSTKYVIIK